MEKHWKIIGVLLVFNSFTFYECQNNNSNILICQHIDYEPPFEVDRIVGGVNIYHIDYSIVQFYFSSKDVLKFAFVESDVSFSQALKQINSKSIEDIDAMAINSKSIDFVFYSYRSLNNDEKLDLINCINKKFSKANRSRLSCWRLYLVVNYIPPLPD